MSRFRLCNVEEAVSQTDMSDVPDDIVETEEGIQLVVSGWSVFVESLNLSLREGIVCIRDEEAGMFMPDYSVTLVYEGDIEQNEWLYYEQDGFAVTLANWLNGRLPMEQIEKLWCELNMPQNNF